MAADANAAAAAEAVQSATPGPAKGPTPAAALLSAVQSGQTGVIKADYQPAVSTAQSALVAATAAATSDQVYLANDTSTLDGANQAVTLAAGQLASDQAGMVAATADNEAAQRRLLGDRARLRGIALMMYTTGATDATPVAEASLQGSQQAVFGQTEATVVSGLVIGNLHADVAEARRSAATLARLARVVGGDAAQLASDRGVAAQSAGRVAADQATLTAAQQTVTGRTQHLTGELAAEQKAVRTIADPVTVKGGLGILGPAALDAKQLVAWYSWSGYADLTPATIDQLAGWYVQAGHQLGVRGDVAFAQAMLETGGFSSSDAVTLNNYAGIGHCDTCAVGWGFPSPQGGVVGHLQLLRIFAEPAGAAPARVAPVLPALTPASQSRQSCCPTWESLTGVWATDPTYGTKVLSIYLQMLQYTLQGPPTLPSVPAAA